MEFGVCVMQFFLKKIKKHRLACYNNTSRSCNRHNKAYGPKFDEILHDCRTNDSAVEGGVGQEEDKELVVGESHTVIHPDGNNSSLVK